jgi:hypothetical protein
MKCAWPRGPRKRVAPYAPSAAPATRPAPPGHRFSSESTPPPTPFLQLQAARSPRPPSSPSSSRNSRGPPHRDRFSATDQRDRTTGNSSNLENGTLPAPRTRLEFEANRTPYPAPRLHRQADREGRPHPRAFIFKEIEASIPPSRLHLQGSRLGFGDMTQGPVSPLAADGLSPHCGVHARHIGPAPPG